MTSFPVPRGAILSCVVMFCVLSGMCAWAMPFPRVWWMITLLAGLFGTAAMFHQRRIIVSDEAICVEYIWRKKVWQLNTLAVSTWGRRNGKALSLRFRTAENKRPVLALSREVLGEQFEPLLQDLLKRGVAVTEDTSVPRMYPERKEVKVNGRRVVIYRGTAWFVHMAIGTCMMSATAILALNAPPWGLPIAGREKIIVCLSVLPLMAMAIWFVPTGVMGVVFKDDTVIIKRVWRSRLVLTRAYIESVSCSPRRNGLRLILLTTSRGTQVRMFEGWLGSQPGELWKELADFAGVEAVQTI